MSIRVLCPLLAALLQITATAAVAGFQPESFDTAPADGKLTVNEQRIYIRSLLANTDAATEPLRDFYYFQVLGLQDKAGPGQAILISGFQPYEPSTECQTDQRFFLRDTVLNLPQIGCVGLGSAPNGALFSYSNNGAAETSTFTFNGAIAFQLYSGYPSLEGLPRSGMHLTRSPISIFAEGHGITYSDKPDEGTIRAGLKTDLLFEGGWFDSLTLTSAIYYQTDMGLGGSGYGAQAVLTPQSVKIYMGGAPGRDLGEGDGDPIFYYLPSIVIDGFYIDEPGETGLAARKDYLWPGVTLALVYDDPQIGPFGAKAELAGSFHVDVVGNQTAALGTATAQIFLDDKKRTSLGISYQNGRQYTSLQDVDTLAFSLGLKF